MGYIPCRHALHTTMSATLACRCEFADIATTCRHVGDMSATFPTKPPILSRHPPNWLPGPVFETSHTSEEKHVRESLRHGVTTHNWFAHYLYDIYKGFGHNGKIIQHTLPSHTQPSPSKLAAWASFRNFMHFGTETCG